MRCFCIVSVEKTNGKIAELVDTQYFIPHVFLQDKHLIVKFPDRESKSLYPGAFEKVIWFCRRILI